MVKIVSQYSCALSVLGLSVHMLTLLNVLFLNASAYLNKELRCVEYTDIL